MGCASSSPTPSLANNAKKLQLFEEQLKTLERDGVIDVRALTLLIWKSRDTPEMSRLILEFVSLSSNDRNAFNGIEFYLPQLAHMMVHLEVDWATPVLEQFTLLVAQQSLHLALQLCWVLVGLMEDYEPENEDGVRNPNGNPKLYNRCAMLLEKLEVSVVYGSPHGNKFEELYKNGTITREELMEAERADRIFQAYTISDGIQEDQDYLLDGTLEYKRWKVRGGFHSDAWRKRRFVIGHRVLYCLRLKDNVLKRSIPLHDCEVVVPPKGENKKEFYFEIRETQRDRKFKLAASSQEEMDKWVSALKKAIHSPPKALQESKIKVHDLSPAQVARYGFYRSEREFVRRLTDICEELRFISNKGKIRTTQLQEKMGSLSPPGCVYIPLCKSTDPWQRVLTTVPDMCFAFSTKERCPSLMTFEVTSDDPELPLDVATYLYQTLGFDDANIDLDDEALEEMENDMSAPSQRALARNRFVRSARDSITKLDLSSIREEHEEAESNDKMERRPSVDVPMHTLWQDKKSKLTNFTERRRLKVQALKLEAVRLLSPNTTVEFPKQQQDQQSPSQENDLNTSRKYLPALGKYIENNGSTSEEVKRENGDQDEQKHRESRAESVVHYGKLIAKSNDDLRQEVFIMQMIAFLNDIWLDKGLKLRLNPYTILSTSQTCGLIEVLLNSKSFHGIKEKNDDCTIGEYFEKRFTDAEKLAEVRKNFTESMAGYSLATMILGIKDRHNGNIMLEMDTGVVTHIDFGFVFGMAPGKDKIKHTDFSLEKAAFKLTPELVDAMGGKKSENWAYFNDLLIAGLKEAREHKDTMVTLVEIMGYKSKLPCFNQPGGGVERVVRELKQRLMVGLSETELEKKMRKLAEHASRSRLTLLYEKFQLSSNGLRPCR